MCWFLDGLINHLGIMKLKHAILLFSIIVLIGACATQTTVTPDSGATPDSAGTGEGAELFSRAEALFEAGSYAEALTHYLVFVQRFGDESLAAAALMKIGYIYAFNGEYENARSAYRRILRQISISNEGVGFEDV